MEYIEDTIEELQPDGSIALRKVIVPIQALPSTRPPVAGDDENGYIPLGEAIVTYSF